MVDINDSKITDTPGAISLAILGINISFKMWMINLFLAIVMFGSLITMWFVIGREDRYEIIYSFKMAFRRFNLFYTYTMYRKFFKNGKNIQSGSDKFLKWSYAKIDQHARATKKINLLKMKSEKYYSNNSVNFVAVFTCVVICENLIGTILVPTFDVQFSALNLGYWLALRLVTMVPSTLINLAVLYPIYKIVIRAMHYNYTENTSEDINIPLYS
jgi:uncharacterized protein (DUF983 family)